MKNFQEQIEEAANKFANENCSGGERFPYGYGFEQGAQAAREIMQASLTKAQKQNEVMRAALEEISRVMSLKEILEPNRKHEFVIAREALAACEELEK